MATRTPLFADLIRDDAALGAELAKVAVAADLAVLVARSGVSRTELAQRLGWSKARVSQVLGGKGNLTVETMHAVAHAVGARLDVMFRQPGEARAAQPWERHRLELVPATNVVPLPAKGRMSFARLSSRLGAPHSSFTQVVQGSLAAVEQTHAA